MEKPVFSKMKPLLINTFDFGGAANACLRLHKGILKQGIGSKVLLREKQNFEIENTFQISQTCLNISLTNKIERKFFNTLKELNLYSSKPKTDVFLDLRNKDLELFSYPYSNYDITKSDLYKNAELINLHWVADFIDYASFFKTNNKPVVWTLHDQNPFLGGEHYMEEYIGIDNQGFPQKRIITQQERQKFEEIIEIKLGALKNVSNLTIVSLCNWMQNEVKRNSIFKDYRVELIPNGIDSSIFKPRNQDYSKELFGIPQNKTVLLFVADSLNNKRKGFEFILRAIEQLDKNKFVLVTIGFKYSGFIKFKNIIQLGKIKEELLLSIVYSAADVFIIPSLIDNLPNTVIESLMCGTPVIGFPVGGIPDMIQNGKNGYLTEEISVMSLVETIHLLANTIHNFDRDKISKEAILKYAIEIQSENYISLFKEILKT